MAAIYDTSRGLEATGDASRVVDDLGDAERAVTGCVLSFSATTRVVMADGSTKPISQVKPGEMVLSTDPDTGKTMPREVIATLPHTDQLLTLDTTTGQVVTTQDHRYWDETDHAWEQAQNLDAGDQLRSLHGTQVTVKGLNWASIHTAPAYDLTIADLHDFYVNAGDAPVLAHNCDPPFGLPSDVARMSLSHVTDSGETILGSFPGYISEAKARGDSYFDLGSAWNELTRDQQLAANRYFLDTIADKGDRVVLTVAKTEIRLDSDLAEEVMYLTQKRGYHWIDEGTLVLRGSV